MKTQCILVFSDHRRLAAELPLPPDDRYSFTCCASDSHSIDAAVERIHQQRFDWILIDGAAMGGNQKEFVQSLRAIGLLLSEGVVDSGRNSVCKVEWDANGTLHLCCCRKIAACGEPGIEVAGPNLEIDGFVFEYHAPMERTG